jgi:ABC-type transporter Mla subunit MlaD
MYIKMLTHKQSSNKGHNRKEREQTRMDQQEQQRLNQAAEEFTNALLESSKAAADRGVNAQEQNAQLTQEFFNRVIENLRTQAEDTRQMGQQLADQQQRATEAGRTLTQESVSAYMDFVNSMFTFGQQGAQAAQRGTQEAPPRGGDGGGGS